MHEFWGFAIMHAFLSSGGCQHEERDTKNLENESVLVFTFLEQLEFYDKSYRSLGHLENIVGSISEVERASVLDLQVIKTVW